jgi:capsular polysaccharide biosynthesis protein
VNVSEAIPAGRKVHEETTFYVSTYYNMQMLWHALFDFALPLFHTISLFQLDKPPAVIIPKDADKPKLDVVRPFTSSFGRMKNTHCYRDLIVGMSKVKDAETGKLYDFPKNFTHLLMPSILDYFSISEGLPSKPVILVIGRHTSSRVFTNFEEVIEMLVTGFPAFEVKRIYFEDVQMKQQIEAAYKATIMIGVHGSGLSHVAWMPPGTTMIEILPYKFNCRDWYEKATFVSGARYQKYVPTSPDESPNAPPHVQRCWNAENGCDGECLGLLRDQKIKVNVTILKELVQRAVV